MANPTGEQFEIIRAAGAIVIDNSSAFRMSPDSPLIVPEINGDSLVPGHRIIANPNCSTIIAAIALWPIQKALGIERVVAATYQAASGAAAEWSNCANC